MGSYISGLGDTPVTGEPWCTLGGHVAVQDIYSPAPGGLCRADGRMCQARGQGEGWVRAGTSQHGSTLQATSHPLPVSVNKAVPHLFMNFCKFFCPSSAGKLSSFEKPCDCKA